MHHIRASMGSVLSAAILLVVGGCSEDSDWLQAFRKQRLAPKEAAIEQFAAGRWETAIKECNRGLASSPSDDELYILRGECYRGWAEDARATGDESEATRMLEMAVSDFTTAMRCDPTSFEAYYQRALAHKALGRDKEALDDDIRARQMDPRYELAFAHPLTSDVVPDADRSGVDLDALTGKAKGKPESIPNPYDKLLQDLGDPPADGDVFSSPAPQPGRTAGAAGSALPSGVDRSAPGSPAGAGSYGGDGRGLASGSVSSAPLGALPSTAMELQGQELARRLLAVIEQEAAREDTTKAPEVPKTPRVPYAAPRAPFGARPNSFGGVGAGSGGPTYPAYVAPFQPRAAGPDARGLNPASSGGFGGVPSGVGGEFGGYGQSSPTGRQPATFPAPFGGVPPGVGGYGAPPANAGGVGGWQTQIPFQSGGAPSTGIRSGATGLPR